MAKIKSHSKVIYERHYESPSKWGQKIESYILVRRHFDFNEGFRYSVCTPNFSCSSKKLMDAILRVVEHEGIGMAKYNGLKELIYRKNLWNSLC